MFSRKVILRALICAALTLLQFPDQENQVYDLRQRTLMKVKKITPENIVLLDITKEEFESLKEYWHKHEKTIPDPLDTDRMGPWREKFENIRKQYFWDDHVYEGLLKRVFAEEVKKFLVTFFYSENIVTLSSSSSLFKLVRNPTVLWGSQFDLEGHLLKPSPTLTGTENYGFTNLQPDSDGVVRRAYLIYKNHISMPFRALIEDTSISNRLPLSEAFLIRYAGPNRTFLSCSTSDLIRSELGKSSCGNLKGKYVILNPSGSALAGAGLYPTPIGLMNQGEILANILLTAQNQSAFFEISPYLLFLFVFLHVYFLSYIILKFGNGFQLFTGISLLAIEGTLSLFLMWKFSMVVPLIPFLIATIASYVIFLWHKHAVQESKRWQAEKKALYLRELDELKTNFLSLVSHDLKTPIAKIQALTERLMRENKDSDISKKEILESIQRNNNELSEYIISILDFQRIEAKELKPKKVSADINSIIEDVLKRLKSLAKEKNITLESDLEPIFSFEFDEQLIKQVLNNLVDNAIKYNRPGTIVKIVSRDLSSAVEVTVEDNGDGIHPDQLKKLFTRFSRSEENFSERVKGTGLGLYLTKYFIELHGGKIAVNSSLGQGTKFNFQLPINQ